jgi:hypothetical protein
MEANFAAATTAMNMVRLSRKRLIDVLSLIRSALRIASIGSERSLMYLPGGVID